MGRYFLYPRQTSDLSDLSDLADLSDEVPPMRDLREEVL